MVFLLPKFNESKSLWRHLFGGMKEHPPTVTSNVHVFDVPLESEQKQVTGVEPMGKVLPDEGLQLLDNGLTPPVQVGLLQVTGVAELTADTLPAMFGQPIFTGRISVEKIQV